MTGAQPDPRDPAQWAALMGHMQQIFSGSTGPVNWDLARQLAAGIAKQDDRPVTPGESGQAAEALRLADLWLNPGTTLPSGVNVTKTWTRLEWIEATKTTWQRLCDPVAARVVDAMKTLLPGDDPSLLAQELPEHMRGAIPPEMLKQLGSLTEMFAGVGGVVFGAQVGQGLGTLSSEVLSATDIGLPLGPAGEAVLLPANLAAFGSGLELPEDEVRLYVALREAAHQRLYSHVPWLAPHVLGIVETYARGISVDREAFEDAMERMRLEVDPNDPNSMQVALSDGLFTPADTPEQKLSLSRLETALALIEGWVSHLVDGVARDRLPNAAALSETFRRRRGAGGPAEQTFATLVGLELRPRRLREAAKLWRAVEARRGVEGRDAVWAHPDLLPSTDDLDHPEDFAERDPGVDIPGLDEL